MNIYLVQHGKPVSKEVDPEKPLAEQGKEDVKLMAAFLKRIGVEVGDIFHSGKIRARQTAEIMISELNPSNKPIEKGGISPLDDVSVIAEEIKQSQKDLMIVGHLPHLGKLAAYLTTGSEFNSVVSFQQGGVVCLGRDKEEKNWTIAWMLIPEIITA